MQDNLILKPFDIVFVSGEGRISSIIEWATSVANNKAEVSHVSFVTEGGDLNNAVLQEALIETGRITRRKLVDGYLGTNDKVAIYRPLGLDYIDLKVLKFRADETNNRRYGYFNIGLQLLDAIASKIKGHPVYNARRFASDRWQECCHNVAYVFQADGLGFGVADGFATPDIIWDFCKTRTDKYKKIRDLVPLTQTP